MLPGLDNAMGAEHFCTSTTAESRAIFGTSKMHLATPLSDLGCFPIEGGGSVVVDSLLVVSSVVGVLIAVCFVVRYFMYILVLQAS